MDLYIKIFEVIFPVFFVIGVGYYLGKKNPKIDTNFITNFAGNIGTPAMIFYTVTTTGITLSIFTHYFVNIGMVIGLVPTIGIALPFLSYGGSNLMAFILLFAIYIKLDSQRTSKW